MNESIKRLSEAIENKGLKITFGLTENHIKKIESIIDRWNTPDPSIEEFPNMMYDKWVWEEIGNEIGWEPFTAALYYWRYLDHKKETELSQP